MTGRRKLARGSSGSAADWEGQGVTESSDSSTRKGKAVGFDLLHSHKASLTFKVSPRFECSGDGNFGVPGSRGVCADTAFPILPSPFCKVNGNLIE